MRLIVEADGGSRGNPGPGGFGALVRDAATGGILAERAGYLGDCTNNIAEYSGLIAGLRAAHEIDAAAFVEVRMDSKLVVQQMSGAWKIKSDTLADLAQQARQAHPPRRVTYTWVPRSENAAADALANKAMDQQGEIVRDFAPSQGELQFDEVAEAPVRPAPAARRRVARPSGSPVRWVEGEPLTTVFVRHGSTNATVAATYAGSGVPGPSLNARGRTEAAMAADIIHHIGRDMWADLPTATDLVSSPMIRAQETAQFVGRRLGLTPRLDDRFAEADFGEWEGLNRAEVEKRWPGDLARWHHDGDFAMPGGESLGSLGKRVQAGVDDLIAAGVDRTVVVVCHAVTIRAAVGLALGTPIANWERVRITAGSVTILQWWPSGEAEAEVVGWPVEV